MFILHEEACSRELQSLHKNAVMCACLICRVTQGTQAAQSFQRMCSGQEDRNILVIPLALFCKRAES